MNKRVLNVDNGPGSNGLRGGIKQYSARTTTGPWLDTYGGPLGYKRGFTTSDFQTEAQHAQLGVIGRPSGPFGAGIPVLDARDSRGNRLDSVGTETWVSNTKATHPNFGVIRKVSLYILFLVVTTNQYLLDVIRFLFTGRYYIHTVEAETESREAVRIQTAVDR